jgi:LmbE family N-acetylglucosaminyl deacetylase
VSSTGQEARRLTLMAVHAHPDDEATGTGGVLARYASEGIRTVLVTCTDGRCGDGPGGVKPGDPGHEPASIADARRLELEESCRLLQVSDLELLGYADSGMMGWSTNDAPGSFWTTPVAEAAERLSDLMRHYQPDVVVTYDENGFYGHPDHIQAHRVTMAAVARSGLQAKVYWTTAPRSGIEEMFKVLREFDPEFAETAGEGSQDELPDDFGLPDDQISTWVDTTPFARQKYDALAAHASQEENIFFLRMGEERFSQLMSTETFVRVQDHTQSPLPEDDLFAGLR